jgi:hypothetical protein
MNKNDGMTAKSVVSSLLWGQRVVPLFPGALHLSSSFPPSIPKEVS